MTDSRPAWQGTTARFVLVVVLTVVGVFVTLGCLLAVRLELDGFGRPRDTAAGEGYLALLWLGAGLGIAVPAVTAWFTLPGRARLVAAGIGGVALVVVAVLLGLSI